MNENVNVCITPKGDKPILHFSQFDNERVFTVTVLADDGESAAVLTGLDIEFRLRKTDSHVVTIAPESVADNVITFKTTEQLCACCGQNIATITLMKDDMVISTLDILVDIQRDILSGGLTSESDIRNLTTQIEQIVPEVIGDDYYNKQEVDDLLAEHTFDPTNYYDKSDVDGLLADKADAADVYTKSEVDDLLDDKADKSAIASLIVQKDVAKAPIASFNTDLADELTKCIVVINPVQDLHGYSKPWSGGRGKNKLNATGTNEYSTLVDGVYTVTSVPQTGYSWYIGWVDLKAGTYILSGGLNRYCRYYIKAGDDYYTCQGEDVSFTLTSDTSVSVSGVFTPEVTVGNKLKPMIRLASVSDASFEPYSNICPISGFSALNVTLADGEMQTVDTATVNFGQIVYGGVADVTGGKVNKTHGIVDLGTLNWSAVGNMWFASLSGVKPISDTTVPNAICTQYKAVPWVSGTSGREEGIFCFRPTHNQLAVRDTSYSSASDFKTAMSGVMLCYELATQTEITTTPENLTAISGENNVYGDTNGDTEVRFTETIGNELGV